MRSHTSSSMLETPGCGLKPSPNAILAPADPRPAASVPAEAPVTGDGEQSQTAIGPLRLFERAARNYDVLMHLEAKLSPEQERIVAAHAEPLFCLLYFSRLVEVQVLDSNCDLSDLTTPPSNQQEVPLFGTVRDFEAEYGCTDRLQDTRYTVFKTEIPDRLVVVFEVSPHKKVTEQLQLVLPKKVTRIMDAASIMEATPEKLRAEHERRGTNLDIPTSEAGLLWHFARTATWSHFLLVGSVAHLLHLTSHLPPDCILFINAIIEESDVSSLSQAKVMEALCSTINYFFGFTSNQYRESRNLPHSDTLPYPLQYHTDLAFTPPGARSPTTAVVSTPQPVPAAVPVPQPIQPVATTPEAVSKKETAEVHEPCQDLVETPPAPPKKKKEPPDVVP